MIVTFTRTASAVWSRLGAGESMTLTWRGGAGRTPHRQPDGAWKVHRTIWNEAAGSDGA